MSSEQDGQVIPLNRRRAKPAREPIAKPAAEPAVKPGATPVTKPVAKPAGKGADVLAAGARRASGERAKRRGTPLIADSAPPSAPLPVPEVIPPGDQSTHGGGHNPAALLQHAVGAVVEALVTEGRRAGVSDVDQHVAQALAFLRRRLSGDYVVDEFGFDADLTEAVLPALRPLYRSWFRVEVRGIENIPHSGGALVVANHSGTIAMDSLMTQLAVHDEHPASRNLRMLGADLVFATPFIGSFARKTGTTLAIQSDAERLLRSGELVGVWPEGFKGIGKPFSERYKLQRFGRGGFVSAALQAGVPIVPCSIVGAEEIYPILGNFKSLARLLGVPYLPMTPTFPWLGPLGLIPLPSKWIIEFGAPIDTADLDGGADDPMLVFNLTDQVRETIQQTLYALLMQRRSVFFS